MQPQPGELVGARFAGLAEEVEQCPWGRGHAPPLLLEGMCPRSQFLIESWLLAEQGFHGLAPPPRGEFVTSHWVVKLCGGLSHWNFG